MPKKTSTTKTTQEPDAVEHFQAFLAAADRVALGLLIREGVLTDDRIDHAFYESGLEELAKAFCAPFETTNIDDVVHFAELDARQKAAHMVGLALGLRLRGVDFGTTGGAR